MISCDAIAFVVTGQECDVVILTTVRSLPKEDIPDHPSHLWVNENMGFVTDEHLMNVAITRAKEALCIIGKYISMPICDQICQKGSYTHTVSILIFHYHLTNTAID